MKIFLMFLVFPAFLMAQSDGTLQKISAPLDLSFEPSISVSMDKIGMNSGFNQSRFIKPVLKSKVPFRRSTVEMGLMDQTEQNATEKFTKASLGGIEKAGNSLNTSFWLKYGSNFLGLIETLTGYSSTDSDDILLDLSERNTLTNMLGFGAYALELHSINYLGRTGNYLNSLSNNLSQNNSFLLKDASRDLKKARTFGMISTGLGIVGSTASLYALSHHVDSDEFKRGVIIGGSFGLASIILKFLSVNKVDDAGITAGEFSNTLQVDWQKRYFAGFSTGLRDYEKHWKTGFSLTLGGIGLAMASSLTGSEEVARIGNIVGLLSMLAGNIYMNWVAPYQLGSAGDDLYNLSSRLNEQ